MCCWIMHLSTHPPVAENHGGRLTLELPEQDRFRVTVLLSICRSLFISTAAAEREVISTK